MFLPEGTSAFNSTTSFLVGFSSTVENRNGFGNEIHPRFFFSSSLQSNRLNPRSQLRQSHPQNLTPGCIILENDDLGSVFFLIISVVAL